MHITALLVIVNLIHNINMSPIEALHSYMNEPELAYYFKSEYKDVQLKYEVVYLPIIFPLREAVTEGDGSVETDFDFVAFGRSISLKLKLNQHLIAPNFKTYIQYGNDQSKLLQYSRDNCHFLHKDSLIAASISICRPNLVQGLILLDNSTLEIQPLTSRLHDLLNSQQPSRYNKRVAHIVKEIPSFNFNYSNELTDNIILASDNVNFLHDKPVEAASHRPADALTAELALFFDAEAYKIFAPYFGYNDNYIRDMILAYMNGIQALYHHPSLGTSLKLVLVRLDIMKRQPSNMPHYDGERSKLLDSFCNYQKKLNPDGDSNPDHWDMALYVSGLDFFAYENGRKSGVTMGLATVGGVCLPQYACVIAEMGTTNMYGKPYPSAGFTSVFILAHEIGHNLGMHHDSSSNSCPKEGYIMSPSRGVQGETQWSFCSADVMSKLSNVKCLHDSPNAPPPSLDHSRFNDNPGQIFTAKKQCEIFLQDKDAVVSPNQVFSKICYSIECKTPHRSGFYYAGPALEGTECSNNKYCFGGECISKVFPTPAPVTLGGWGPWVSEPCKSSCIYKSRGFQFRRRSCNNPTPVHTDRGCKGSGYDVLLCNDDKICRMETRKSPIDYATEKCKEFSKLIPELDPNGSGLQAPHELDRLWMACAIFCRKHESGIYYTPRVELNDMGVSPYFPEGTLCHADSKGENYFCRHHHCLPESFQFNVGSKNILLGLGDDIPISQNANPYGDVTDGLELYLSLLPNGKPLQTILKPGQVKPPKEEDWETKDYLELPSIV